MNNGREAAKENAMKKRRKPQEHGDHMVGKEAQARAGDTESRQRLEEDHRKVTGDHHPRGLKRSHEHEAIVDPAAARDHQSAATERTHDAKSAKPKRGAPGALSFRGLMGRR